MKPFKIVKDSSITFTITAKPNSSSLSFPLLLMLPLLLLVPVLCGNAVLWKVMEKSGKSIRIFPQLTHNTWKSRRKRPTFPHSHKAFSLRSLKCGKTRHLNSKPTNFSQIPNLPSKRAYKIGFFHIPTIFGYFLFYDEDDIGVKKFLKFLGKKAKSTFIFLNSMVYKNGNSNCRRGESLIVVDQSLYHIAAILNPPPDFLFFRQRRMGSEPCVRPVKEPNFLKGLKRAITIR
jgi:hypothetical protein